ncbi:MAG: 30S ribosomal protein S4 [Clostridia bacterium]|jgi:small subunit ribosomal protein S4|nr:30S ribosomal protein S4 [Clostridia bacterium]MBQ3496457.1 30S ribosomal protein S4 [Clostridia bacterium]MBQ4586368.1 30S ribosomal protein S4 [Clostridia bacterium]MBQ6883667.1 30S ribosomal protein S4 [Clostridia bacterium]MBR2933535.1 30S ribosomal protein S4 [Clostridia bacterium]
MAKYTESKCRLCRREGAKLFLKGERCYKSVCPFERRPVAPGQHAGGRRKISEYGQQLREKQKVKRIYGVLEGQFRAYYEKADRMKGITGQNMLSLLERRLDNVVYRMGIAVSRSQARQLVTHGHFTVNGRNVDIASYQVKANDVIAVRENKKDNKYFAALKEVVKNGAMPKWVDFDPETLKGKVLALPQRDDIDAQITEQMIVELYSK